MSSAKKCSFRLGLNVLTHWLLGEAAVTSISIAVILNFVSRIDIILSIFCETALRWMPQDLTDDYRKTFGISRTKYQNLNVSCIPLQLPSLNPLKPGVKLRMKM